MSVPDRVRELLNREIPDKLWHYTSFNGFQGIISSKAIHATDIRFLNDRSEFTHAHDIAKQIAEEAPEFGSNLFPTAYYLKKAVDLTFETGILHPDRRQVFVSCFSAAEDQLSQWRGYSRGSTGVSLGLNLAELRPPADVDTLVCFAPCVYDLSGKKALVQFALDHFMKEAQQYWDATREAFLKDSGLSSLTNPAGIMEAVRKLPATAEFNKKVAIAAAKMRADLLRIAALAKDQAFCEEREWRLVLPLAAEHQKLRNPPKYRAGGTTLVPYISHPFSPNAQAPTPLVDVILGPGSDPSATQAVRSFLRSERVMAPIRESKVPYRPS